MGVNFKANILSWCSCGDKDLENLLNFEMSKGGKYIYLTLSPKCKLEVCLFLTLTPLNSSYFEGTVMLFTTQHLCTYSCNSL